MKLLFCSLFVPMFLVLVFRFLNRKYSPPIFGIYQKRNKNYWFKFVIMYTILRIRQLFAYLKGLLDIELGRSADGTIHVHQQDVLVEEKYFLGDDPLAVDAVYLNGLSSEGEAVVCGVARRQGHVCDAFLMLKVKGEELLLSRSLPDTCIKQEVVEQGEYRAQGIEISKFIPMRTWRLSFDGDMKLKNDPEKRLRVKVSLTWSAHWAPFKCDTQLSPRCLADAIAREPWTRDYFRLLKKLHQTHYEQMGFIKGTVSVDGQDHTLNMPCVRDHSFGPFRDWRTFHRYIMHFILLENGDCINIAIISQPLVLSQLVVGYLCRKSDQKVFPIDSCDLQLYQHGENKIMPRDYGFTYEADGQIYAVHVNVNDEEMFYMGKDRESKLYERWCTVQVNDNKGWACVEWQYNNV